MRKERFVIKAKFNGEWEVAVEASNLEEARELGAGNVIVSVDTNNRKDIELISAECETDPI